MRRAFASLALLLLCAAPAAAQSGPQAPPVLDQVYACAQIAAEAERLACYDTAVGRLRQAQSSGELVAVDRAQAQEIERDAFGFSLPSLPRFFGGGARPDAEPNVGEVQLAIARISHRADGKALFIMSNGQVWAQIDDANVRRARAGGAVTIRRAALGSYLMSVEAGGPAIRVRRAE